MSRPLERPARYEDLLDLPEHRVGQIIDGELHAHPRPCPLHALVSTRLGADLTTPFDRGRGGPGGWLFLDEPELHLGDDVLVPDLAAWRRERMPELPVDAAWISLACDWIGEVLSPSTQAVDRSRKMRIYAREAVRWAWLVDPEARTLEAYERPETLWLRLGSWAEDECVRTAPFDAIELALGSLWAR